MTEYDVKRLARVLAVQAEIDGMKTDNALCDIYGETPNFKKCDFDSKAEELRILAAMHDYQL